MWISPKGQPLSKLRRMETIELAQQDRERLDNFIKLFNTMPDVLVSCTEAARLLGKSPNTISKMIHDGRLHRSVIGRSTGIRLSDIRKINAQ